MISSNLCTRVDAGLPKPDHTLVREKEKRLFDYPVLAVLSPIRVILGSTIPYPGDTSEGSSFSLPALYQEKASISSFMGF